jgi:UDP-N-acetylglucosamine acyltransferase
MSEIHSSAIISPDAVIAEDVVIGPFTIVEPDVTIGAGTKIYNNVTIKSGSRIGKRNIIYQGSVIAAIPQDLKFAGEYTEVFIGDENSIREFVTVSRGTAEKKKTIIGSGCLFMANSHVGHDCIIGNHCIFANSVALGGHVETEDYVRIGGLVGVHQFVKIGTHSMIGAHAMVVKDVAPFGLYSGNPMSYEGLNLVGLRRADFDDDSLETLKQSFKLLFNSGLNVSQAVEKIKNELPQTNEIKHLIKFIELSSRGITK